MVFFLPCDHGLDFDISLCENLINQSINAGAPTATRVSFSFSFSLEISLFSSIFVPSLPFSLLYCMEYGEYAVRPFLPDGVFLPCDHGLDFFYQFM